MLVTEVRETSEREREDECDTVFLTDGLDLRGHPLSPHHPLSQNLVHESSKACERRAVSKADTGIRASQGSMRQCRNRSMS